MSSTWHTITIKAGPYDWTVTKNMGASIGDVLDGLKVATAWSEDNPIQGEPGPWTASFGVIVDTIRDVADLVIGSPVTITVWYDEPHALFPGNPDSMRLPLVHYMGRVSDLDASPTKKGRMLVQVTSTDYLVDLAERTVGSAAWPQELVADRVTRIFNEAGVPCPVDFLYGTVAARDAEPVDALSAVQGCMANEVDPSLPSARYAVPVPTFTMLNPADPADPRYDFGDAPDPFMPYTFMTGFKRPVNGNADTPFNLPCVLALVGGVVTVVLDPTGDPGANMILPASMALRDTAWHKARSTRPDAVTVTSPTGAWYYRTLPNAVPIEFRFESDLVATGDLIVKGDYLLPDQVEDGWSLDEVKFFDLPEGVAPPWLVSYGAQDGTRQLAIIDGVLAGQNPNGGNYYPGMVTNAAIEFRKGNYEITLQMRSDIPRPYGWTVEMLADLAPLLPPYLNCSNLAADPTLGATTPADLDPLVTPYDLRTVRRPD